jgi:hypothetical protein
VNTSLTCTIDSPILLRTHDGHDIVFALQKIKHKEGQVRIKIRAPKKFVEVTALFNKVNNVALEEYEKG